MRMSKSPRGWLRIQLLSPVLVVALSAALAACNNSSDSGNGGTTDQAAVSAAKKRLEPYLGSVDKIAITAPLDSAPPKGKSVYMVRYNEPVAARVDAPLGAATKALGWDLKVLVVEPTDPQSQGNAMKQAISGGADYIVVVGGSAESMGDGLTAAKQADIPVFTHAGSTDPAGKENGIYGNAVDEFVQDASLRLLDKVVVDSNGAGDVLFLTTPDFPILAKVSKDVLAQFPKNCPECSIKTEDVSIPDLTGGQAPSLTVSTLRKNPGIKYVVASFDTVVNGVPEALQAAGLNDVKVYVVAPDATKVKGLSNGSYRAMAMLPNSANSWLDVDMMARHSLGMKIDPVAHDSERYPIWTSDSVPKDAKFEGAKGYEEQYKKLWKIG
ncbi:sugar ABC transporter substrate-binding protein [Spirillospora sp. CA-255316]